MTPKEKLERLVNPKSVEDYGLSVSFSELETFDEGRNWITNFYKAYVPVNKWPKECFPKN